MSTNSHELGSAIRLALTLLALVLVWQRIVLPTLAENLRQAVFEQRRALFLYMAEGNVSPSEPAYGFIRSSMNLTLRIAERFTFSRLLFLIAAWRFFACNTRPKSDELLDRVADEGVRARLTSFRDQHVLTTIAHAVLNSPVAGPVVRLLALFSRSRNRAQELFGRPKRRAIVETEAGVGFDDDDDRWSLPPEPSAA